MIAGTCNSENAPAIVRSASQDLRFSLDVKRGKMRRREFTLFAQVESIIFELDRGGRYDPLEAMLTGRRLHWPSNGPNIGFTKPEEDLVFTEPWRFPLPELPDPHDVIDDPYGFKKDPHPKVVSVTEPRKIPQLLEERASGLWGRWVILHPVAEIIARPYSTVGRGAVWASLRVLTGWDGRQMALLVNPYDGEAFFSGGRIQISFKG
jgi:hypothetical protein